MQVFVYEHVLAVGAERIAQGANLVAEASAMRAAVLADFAALDGCHAVTLSAGDVPNGEYDARFAALAAESDWTLVIAPESDGVLRAVTDRVTRAGGRLLGPTGRMVEPTADKHTLCEQLQRAGVPAPEGIALGTESEWPATVPWPAVMKPRFGCGCQQTRLLPDGVLVPADGAWRVEQYCPGTAASVAVLCGPVERVALPASQQSVTISPDGEFSYRGGLLPLPPALARRAADLALRALEVFPDAQGYVGIDLVLGESADGRDDCVIEINPRLTTSYVGLRAACESNLAAAMLRIITGEPADLRFRPVHVRYTAAGHVTVAPGEALTIHAKYR